MAMARGLLARDRALENRVRRRGKQQLAALKEPLKHMNRLSRKEARAK